MTNVVSTYVITKYMARHLEDSDRSREIWGKVAVQTRLHVYYNPEISQGLPALRNDEDALPYAGLDREISQGLTALRNNWG
jgi:hypothetical protein